MYNAGWNTNSLLSKRLSFVHNGSAYRKAARKSTFENVHFGGKKDITMCPNHSAFTKHNWIFFKVQNLPAGGLRASVVPSPYFSRLRKTSLWKLIAEVNPIAEPVVENQGGGLELSAVSPRSCTAGFSSKESSLHASSPAPVLLSVGPCSPFLPGVGSLWSPTTVPSHLPLLVPLWDSFLVFWQDTSDHRRGTFSNWRTHDLLAAFQVSEEVYSEKHLCVLLFKTQLCNL